MADKEGFYYEETLTGFKWLGNRTDELKKQKNITCLFAFEEAIGFMIGDICLDKDGIRAAACFGEMAVHHHNHGKTALQRLGELQQKYGYFATNNRYYFCYDPKLLDKIFTKMRNGGQYCTSVGEYKVKNIRDLTTGYDNSQPNQKAILPTSSSTQMITYFFENGCVATLRGSGTEPKLKYYVELSGTDKTKTIQILDDIVHKMVQQFLEPEKNGLEKPKD